MGIENEQLYRRLRQNFFTHKEATKLSHPRVNQNSDERQDVTSDYYKNLITKAIRSRLNYVNNCVSMGWSYKDIANSINMFYRSESHPSAFEFIRSEYMIPAATGVDYKKSVEAREKDINKNRQKALISRARIRGWAKGVIGRTYLSKSPPQRKSHFDGKMIVKNAVNQENKLI